MRLRIPIFALLCLIWTAALAQKNLPTTEYTLNNGLQLIVREDHRAPIVTVQVWYKVGSSYEHTGITGVSHILEHMLFKGTDKHPGSSFSDTITSLGGSLNAFTSYDYTGYYQSLPKEHLATVLELEADRMRNINFSEEAFTTELQVVIEERRLRVDDVPERLTYERFNATTFTNSTYRHPVVGWPDDIKNATRQESLDWYKTWYAPNNAIVVVVGDVDPAEVKKYTEKYFAHIKESKIPSIFPQQEVQALGEKRIVVKRPAKLPTLYMGFPTPVYATAEDQEDIAALTVLASILDGGQSARFAKHLVREQAVAASACAWYMPMMRQDYMLVMQGIPKQTKTVQELEDAIWQEVLALQTKPVSKQELARAKAQFKASDIYQKDSISAQAREIGSLVSIGLPWETKDKFLDEIDKVTAKQVQAVAQKYLTRDNLTVAVLQPIDTQSEES
jgi:zinc protease